MQKNIIIIIGCVLLSNLCIAQKIGANEFHVNWEFGMPVGNDFITKFSALGFNAGYGRFVTDDLAVGIEIGWNNYYELEPKKTYEFPEGAVTTDLYKYIYTLPIVLNVAHYFEAGKMLSPYVRLGLGAQYSEQNIYYNIYETTNDNWGFVAIPEAGTIIHFGANNPMGAHLSVRYKYSTNSAENLGVNNLQTLNFAAGFSWIVR
jgi:hypothetical protein